MIKQTPSHIPAEYLRPIGAAHQKLLAGPERISINIVSECPLRCSFCWSHSFLITKSSARPKPINMATIRHITDAAAQWDVKYVHLVGRGEPTTHPDFSNIISELSSKKVPVRLLTNATFPEKLAPAIAKIQRISITLCAPDRTNYIKIHAPKNPKIYARILENIKLLSFLRKKYGHPFTEVVFILTHQTIPLIPHMMEWLTRTGIARLHFQVFRSSKETSFLSPDKNALLMLLNIIKIHSKKDWPFEHNLHEIKELLRTSTSIRPARCFTGWFSLYIDSDSSVRFCCLNKHTLIGSLRKNTIEEIWSGQKANKTRLRWLTPLPPDNPLEKDWCANCVYVKENLLQVKRVQHINDLIKQYTPPANQLNNL